MTLTASVAAPAGLPVPAGKVQFMKGSTVPGTVRLTNGFVTLNTTFGHRGPFQLKVICQGVAIISPVTQPWYRLCNSAVRGFIPPFTFLVESMRRCKPPASETPFKPLNRFTTDLPTHHYDKRS